MRKIIHIDMDAFFAAVEERDNPELAGLPIAVGGGSPRGVVMTASYAARRYGVRSAMPGTQAARLCPELIFVPARFEAYRAVSRQIRAIFHRQTDLVEPLSLDEAYLDVTQPLNGIRPAETIAKEIKAEIKAATELTASAGVAANKFLAKLASDMDKPDGLCVIRPSGAIKVLASLPIERFHGVGPATARRLKEQGIDTGQDLQRLSELEAVTRLGRLGSHFWRLAQGIDEREVQPRRLRKSQSVETTFASDLRLPEELTAEIDRLAEDLAARLAQTAFQASTVTLKIKYRDFRVTSRQTTLPNAPSQATELAEAGRQLLARAPLEAPVRLLGLGVGSSGVVDPGTQLQLPLDDQMVGMDRQKMW